jgi:predicted metal-dependent phosphoesterase TrpH
MLLKGCLHVHTTCSDGKLAPQKAADVYAGLGYDFIAFTDHDYLLKPGADEVYDAVESDLIIFKGVEMTVFERGYIHINRIYGDNEELWIMNHLGDYDLPVDQIVERIDAIAERFPLHAVDITSKGFPRAEFETDAIALPKIASDDSHSRLGCGRAWIEMDCRRSKDSILRAVKKSRFWNCYKRG